MSMLDDPQTIKIIKDLINTYKIRTIVETGTYDGTGIRGFSLLCNDVYSIEIKKEFFDKVTSSLIKEGFILSSDSDDAKHIMIFGDRKITLIHGNSPDVIKKYANEFVEPILFFLDAHGPEAEAHCPILEELEAVREKPNSLIIIHDFKVPGKNFGFDNWNGRDLDLNLVQDKIIQINNDYKIFFNEHKPVDGAGILFAVPPEKGGEMIDRVLFVNEQFYSANPKHGVNVIDTNYRDTLWYGGFAKEIRQIYFTIQNSCFVTEEVILEACGSWKPNVIFFFPTGWVGIDPSRQVFSTISRELGIPIIVFRGDCKDEFGKQFNESWFPYVDYIVFIDASIKNLGYGTNSKAIQGIQSFNDKIFYDRKILKDIDVSFVGMLEREPRRAEWVNYFRANGINVVTLGGHEKGNLSWEDYGSLMSRSKISLNFTSNMLKGRIFEIMASRTMVIEDNNVEQFQFFVEGEEVVTTLTKEDMLAKIKYFLSNDAARQKITDAGYEKVVKLYNTKNMWAYILNKAGFNVSGDKTYEEYHARMEHLR